MEHFKQLNTLVDVLKKNYASDKTGITFINGNDEEKCLSYSELYRRSLHVLRTFQVAGLQKGDELILQIEENEQFLTVFWGCLLGGIIPVPVSIGNNNEHKEKLFKIWGKLKNPYLVIESKTLDRLKQFSIDNHQNEFEAILEKVLFTNEGLISSEEGKEEVLLPNDIAFIQFSSGSTGEPKGVTLTHENLLTNIIQMVEGSQASKKDNFLSWMPLTHDMGIIGMHLVPLAVKAPQYLMPTALFIRRPTLWLMKVNQHAISITSSPNFGYRYFLMHFNPDAVKEWDLSHVRLILNGAEPISAELCHAFLEKLSVYGLKKTSILTVYGMAEASLGVTFPPLNQEFITLYLDRKTVNVGEKVRILMKESKEAVSFVDVGYPLSGCNVRICDIHGKPLNDYTVGFIQIKGKNVTKEYYNDIKKTREIIQEGWLNTGDLGFMNNGRLVITGRAKDIIFVNGQNYYPHDIERVAENLGEIKLGYIAACGVMDFQDKSDKIILFVVYKKDLDSFLQLSNKLKSYINFHLGINITHVIPVKKIPKTTSGKFERYKLTKNFQDGEYISILQELSNLEKELSENINFSQYSENILEEKLKGMVEKIFNIQDVDIEQNFFDLGGDSLLLTKLHEEIEGIYPGKVMVADLFAYPTVSKLAKYIERSEVEVQKNFILTGIPFPSNFFKENFSKGEGALFNYQVNEKITNGLRFICEEEQIEESVVLLAFFVILLSKVSRTKEIPIQVSLHSGEMGKSLKIILSENTSLRELIIQVKDILENEGTEYRIEDVPIFENDSKNSTVLPLFSSNNNLSSKVIGLYDFVLFIDKSQGELKFILQFNDKFLKKEKMKSFFTQFIKLTEYLLTEYFKEKKGVLN